jgi:MFS family permease
VKAVGLPVVGLGVLYAVFQLIGAGAASMSGWLEDRFEVRGFFGVLVPIFGIVYAGIAIIPLAVLPALFLYRGTMNAIILLRNKYLNDRLEEIGRATVLSGAQMVLTLGTSTASLIGGVVAETTRPVQVFFWIGVSVAILAGLLWITVSPVRSADDESLSAGEDDDTDGLAFLRCISGWFITKPLCFPTKIE